MPAGKQPFAFPDQAGQNPVSGLIQASDGNIYGTAHTGGAPTGGTLFRVHIDGTDYWVMHDFGGLGGGVWPDSDLVEGINGLLYGATYRGGSKLSMARLSKAAA